MKRNGIKRHHRVAKKQIQNCNQGTIIRQKQYTNRTLIIIFLIIAFIKGIFIGYIINNKK